MGHYDSCYEYDESWWRKQLDEAARNLHKPIIPTAYKLTISDKETEVAKQPHYTLSPEPIDIIEKWGLNFYRANVIKYVARAGKKDASVEGTVRDLEKAVSYLKREINALRGTPSWD